MCSDSSALDICEDSYLLVFKVTPFEINLYRNTFCLDKSAYRRYAKRGSNCYIDKI